MSDIERDDISLQHQFEFCEDTIKKLEDGKQIVTKSVDELSTRSLNYLFLPYYLATVTQNLIVEPKERLSSLDRAKIYLRDFLKRLKSYSIIDFDLWDLNEDNGEKEKGQSKHDIDLSKQRELKLRRFQQEKELEELVKSLESELYTNADDDGLMRELILNRLHLAAMKSISEIEQIDQERPMVEHMLKIQAGEAEILPKQPMNRFAPTPYIIARDEVQKKVFGLGYPSIPTMTVNEWYDDMVKNGRFNAINPSSSEKSSNSNAVDEETREEQERARLQRWDEYKDHHRRGWGNMHNKG
ncbi:hypothetical protein WUBG_03617 [Wuchereria bancrofti]|uniref:TAP42-like family protein n=1 Tax=Wuchereria bancrofti TaxID=6293 RepID=J9FDM0_WUCBA|nr:hypothetical protein WUBG_03617 [Wuchereria bancrofti]